jgi:hypothetical protein
MEPQKPKKALRHLFTKTEPNEDGTTLENNESTPSPEISSTQMNLQRSAEAITRTKSGATSRIDSEEPTIMPLVNETEATSHNDETVQQLKTESSITKSSEIEIQSSPLAKEKEEGAPYSFVKIQYNLDLFQAERGTWQEQDYISFINRIDQAQTDAFFLKGRLVSEVKERFYLNNKKGWILFCDDTLNMNYTTANQYIRVSQEFDVTSHQRKDFGFEHFKALLPLTKEERTELLTHTPGNLSVKGLRNIVAKKLQNSSSSSSGKNNFSSKNIVETLQKLKLQIEHLKDITLTQEEKWQLYGAFQNLSTEMDSISRSFIENTMASGGSTIIDSNLRPN